MTPVVVLGENCVAQPMAMSERSRGGGWSGTDGGNRRSWVSVIVSRPERGRGRGRGRIFEDTLQAIAEPRGQGCGVCLGQRAVAHDVAVGDHADQEGADGGGSVGGVATDVAGRGGEVLGERAAGLGGEELAE